MVGTPAAATPTGHARIAASSGAVIVQGRAIGQPHRAIDALLMMGHSCSNPDRPDESLQYFDEVVAMARDIGDRARLSYALKGVGGCHMDTEPQLAIPLLEEWLALAREVSDHESVAITLQTLARCRVALAGHRQARAEMRESLEIARRIGSRRVVIHAIDVCAGLAGQMGHAIEVARFLGAANVQWQRMGVRRPPGESGLVERAAAAASERLGAVVFSSMQAEGQALSLEQAAIEAQAWLATQT